MASKSPTNPTKRAAYRLAQLREKMSALRQEEEKIRHGLTQELSQCLTDAGAFEVPFDDAQGRDFDALLGGILEVIAELKAEATKASSGQGQGSSPERRQRIEGWRKSGLMFQQGRRQAPSNVKNLP